MNEDPLETELRSWKPRVPSAELRSRIFSGACGVATPAAGEGRLCAAAPWQWLAPAFVGAIMILLSAGGDHKQWAQWAVASTNSIFEAAALDNPQYSAYLPGGGHSSKNQARPNLEWTISAGSTSSMDSFSNGITNHLLQ